MEVNSIQSQALAPVEKAPSVSDYMDYRAYLQDFYIFRRRQTAHERRPYSYAFFAAAADIKSPNYLKMIIESRRNLSDEMVVKFSRALGHSREEADEFAALVAYNQELDAIRRNEQLRRLMRIRIDQQRKTGVIDQDIWDRVPNWIVWVLYAMLDQEGVDLTLESVKILLKGKVSDYDINTAIKALFNAGVVEKDPISGKIKKIRNWSEASEEIPVALIRKLQTEFLYLGLEALYQDNPLIREFGSQTLSLTQAEFEELKFQLRKFRKKIYSDNVIQRMSSKGDRVYQFNIQLFELTHPAKDPEIK